MLGTRWKIKPPLGYEIDWQHPLAQGLQFFAPLWEGSGPVAYDLVTGAALAMNAGPTWSRAGSSAGLAFQASNCCVQATAPPALRFGLPGSIALGFRPLAAPANNSAPLFGTTYASTSTSPYYGVAFQYGNSLTNIGLEVGLSGSQFVINSSAAVTYGQDCVLSASVTSGSQLLYQNGFQAAASTFAGTLGYGSNPWIQVGATSIYNRNPNILAYWGAMWNRTLAPAEHAALAANIWQIFQPKRTLTASPYGYAWPTTFQATPGSVPSNHPGHITVQLAGSYTNWTGGTTFTVSGVAGTTLAGQSVIDRRTATITIATGTGTGPLTISDGTVSTTIQVLIPALGCTTMGSVESGTYAATLTGTNTTWLSETPTTLFSISGVSGASISGIAVQSNTVATATIAVGTTAGTGVVTDTSTGATATIAVMAPPVGSLQLTGPLLLGPSPSSTLFGNKASATIAFKVQIDADTVPADSLATGTTLVGWGTNVSGGVGLAVYYPATNTLTITAYGASGKSQTLTWSTVIQLEIGYSFVISWASGAQVIYQDGVPVASSAFAANTYAYQQVQVGSGSPVAVNHQVSNLVVWSGYAASQADALALMNGTMNPIQVGGGASAWWPLGGGITGANPALADVWIADATGNGNALATVSGSLTNARYAGAIAVQAPITVAPHITKCGRLAMFGSIAAAPAANGVHPHQPITAVNSTPTVYRNGSAVQLGPVRWFNESLDSPFVAYMLQCGSVDRIAIQSGGTGYTGTPSASWSGGGGSGLVLGTPTTASGITSYSIGSKGFGYSIGPTVTITDPGGSGTGAVAYAIVISGAIVGYWISHGGSGYSNPTVTISGAGSKATAVATQSSGVVTAVNAVTCGSGYNNPPIITVSSPPSTSGPTGNITAQVIAVMSPVGGVGYTSPKLTPYGGGGSGATFTVTLNTATGAIASVTVTGGGSGYTESVSLPIAITDSTGYGAVLTATTNSSGVITAVSVSGGAIVAVLPICAGLMGYGSGYVSATASPPGGTGATLTAMLSSGAIASVVVTSGGSGYPANSTLSIAILDSAGSGAVVTCTTNSSGVITGTPTVVAGGSGYVSPTLIPYGANGSGAAVTATVSSYVKSIPVSSPGSGFTSLPTITISGGNGTGATVVPIMTGVSAGDTITYSASIGWFMTALGGPAAATNAAVTNWTGQLEGPTNGMIGFQAAPTMLLGASVGAQPSSVGSSSFTAANRCRQGGDWFSPGGIALLGPNGFPLSWTGLCAEQYVYYPNAGNGLDGMTMPNQTGQWTVQYDDSYVNTSSASAVVLTTIYANGTMVAPVSISGNNNAIAGTVTISGGVITAIAVSSGGTGYQGAGVWITGTGSGVFATATVVGGSVTAIHVINGGSGWSGTPTVTIFGTAVSGTAVTKVFDFTYDANPTNWQLGLTMQVANTSKTWTISNPWVVAPVATTGLAATVNRSNPLAVDANVLALLNVNGKVPGALRFMDSTGGYGGIANYIDASDLAFGPQANGDATWYGTTQQYVSFPYLRYVNTNPAEGSTGSGGNGTYNWPASTKVYGTQSWMIGGSDAPFTITGTLTAGSAVVTAVSATTGIIAGATITGAAIPAGTSVAVLGMFTFGNVSSGSAVVTGIAGASMALIQTGMAIAAPGIPTGTTISAVGTNQITLSANATGTASQMIQIGSGSLLTLSQPATTTETGETLSITNPPYFSLPATDNGYFCANGYNSNTTAVVELWTGGAAHGLKTGQYGYVYGSATGYPVTNGTVSGTAYNAANELITFYVTSPSTVVVTMGGINIGAPQSNNPLWINSTTPVTVNWTVLVAIPYDPFCVPYEYAAAMCQQVGCDLWLNIPHAASDGLVQAIAAKVMANIGPTANVYLEFGNENWNSSFPSDRWHTNLSILMGYLTPGTSLFDGHLITYGQTLPNGAYGCVALTTSHAFDVFATAWTAAGLSASRIKRSYGSWWNGTATTQSLAASLQQFNITAVDHVHVATYMVTPTDFSIASAMAPLGVTVSNAGSWPVDAINDIFRYWLAYSQANWGLWQRHAQYCQGLGQPLYATTTAATGGGSTGGSLPAGAYHVGYTFLDAIGRETTLGFSETTFTILSGNIPTMAMPSWPVWAQSMNLYLTQAGGASGSEVLYMTIPRSSYGYGNAYPIGTGIPLSASNTGTVSPPTVNLAVANTPQIPTLACYEGSVDRCPATNSPLQIALSHDRWLDSSASAAVQGYAVACQQGCPTFPGSGSALTMYFQLFYPPQYPDEWTLSIGSQQLPGTGPTTLATVQGNASFDGHSHLQGTSPALLAFQNWIGPSSPTPPTTSTGGRRWFSGLRKPVMRLGR